jgi:hypothetical protein
MASRRFRERFIFWLDLNRNEDFEVADMITDLKQERNFTATVRDGIRLICDLRAGRVGVLLELFPWLKAELQSASPVEETTSDRAIKEQLDRLEKLMVEQGSVAVDSGSHPTSSNGHREPKAMNVPKFDAPNFEDGDDLGEIVIRKDTSTQSAQNFINSMMNLQQ